MRGDPFYDAHCYIDLDGHNDHEALGDLLDWLHFVGTPGILRVDKKQTAGTIHCARYDKIVTFHPADLMWLRMQRDPFGTNDLYHYFTHGLTPHP